jgi:nicotinamide-nucleotide amidase
MMLDWIANRLGEQLKEKGWVLATAESCTGGWVAQTVTSVSGSSEWFDRGFVTYSNDAKREMIGVRTETLDRHGAVSEETVREMAAGALAASRAQIALAITGVAGPTGGTPQKPVGMVCFAWAVRGGSVDATTKHFEGDREAVRRQSVMFGLQGLLDRLND